MNCVVGGVHVYELCGGRSTHTYVSSLIPSPTSGRHFILGENKMAAGSGSGYETSM